MLARRSEAAQHLNPDRIIEHALPKSFKVLLRQHSRGGQHRYLFAIHYRFKGGADRDLGFAETDVPAN